MQTILTKTTPFQAFRITVEGSGDEVSVRAFQASVGPSGNGAEKIARELTVGEGAAQALITEYVSQGFKIDVPAKPKPIQKPSVKSFYALAQGRESGMDDEFFDDQYGYLMLRK